VAVLCFGLTALCFLLATVLFLVDRVFLLVGRVVFLAGRVAFLAGRVAFLGGRLVFLAGRVVFVAGRVVFLAGRVVIFLVGRVVISFSLFIVSCLLRSRCDPVRHDTIERMKDNNGREQDEPLVPCSLFSGPSPLALTLSPSLAPHLLILLRYPLGFGVLPIFVWGARLCYLVYKLK
jgi:hypothetical protein